MKSGEDLRRIPRLPHLERLETQYSVMDNDVHIEKIISLEMLDLNFQGIGVQTELPLPVDATVNFDIYFDGDVYNVTTRVLWTKRNESVYRSGLHFEAVPDQLILSIKRFLTDLSGKRYQN